MTDLTTRVNKAIDSVRPYLQADGGDITLLNITEDLIAEVRLLGACGSCPFSIQTLKNGVEQAIKKEVPEIKEVVNVAE
ncbi:MAG: NifU family protein [Bacteroidales bacterium]|nr:NifU family protein [Bacteroidales bacterium]